MASPAADAVRHALNDARLVAQLARAAVVSELAATISHELRQPLTAMRVNADYGANLLREPMPDMDEVRQVMADLANDASRAAATIEQIRSLLRRHCSTATAVDLNDVSQHVGSLLRCDAAARGVQLELQLEAGLPSVDGNAIELQKVILNLAFNGLEAVAAVSGARNVVIGTASANGSVELYVRDSGTGLSTEARAHLFEPFFTTKEHGLGLGLAIVRTLVRQHGGSVVATNNADVGATFRFTLPEGVRLPDVAPRVGVAALTGA